MRIKRLIPLLAAGAAALATVAAPMAAAAPTPFPKPCVATAAGSACQSPGTVEIISIPPARGFYPYGTAPFLVGRH